MDFHTAHNIVHADAGNNSTYCGYCNGSMDKKACETKAGEILKTQQNRRSMNSMMYGGEDGKKNFLATARVTVHKKDVFPITEIKASEDGNLPDEIQIMPIGEWDTVPYGKLTITASDIQQMIENFKKGVRAGDTLPIDVDHDGKQAAGWMKELLAKDDGLWAKVEWNDLGKDLLGNKRYKFFSPEFNPSYVDPENKNLKLDNVLIAGSLVNRPLFKELEPIVAHEGQTPLLTNKKSIAMLFIEPMKFDLAALRTKTAAELKPEEIVFLKENLSALTADEKMKLGFEKPADVPVTKETAPTITAAEVVKLKEDAELGRKAAEELKTMKIEEKVKGWTFSETGGKFAPALKEPLVTFIQSLNDDQQKTFSELVEKLPDQKALFKEFGSGENLTASQAQDKLTLRAKELVEDAKKAGQVLKFSEAVKKAATENPELANYELTAVQGRMVAPVAAAAN